MHSSLVSSKPVLLALTLGGAITAHADFVFSGDFDKGEGQIELASPLSFSVVEGGFLTYIVFDNIVTYDGDFTTQTDAATFSLLYNGGPTTNGPLDFIDNFNNTVGNIDSNDGAFQFEFADEIGVIPGDTITLQAGTWTNLGSADFNPDYNSVDTFVGNVRLATNQGTILAEHVCIAPVPEPSSLALFGLGLLAFTRRKRA